MSDLAVMEPEVEVVEPEATTPDAPKKGKSFKQRTGSKCTIERAKFTEAVRSALAYAARKSSLEVLTYIKLDIVGDAGLVISATNLEQYFITSVEVLDHVNGDVAAICVPAKTLAELLPLMEGKEVVMQISPQTMKLQLTDENGRNYTELSGLDVADFPPVPQGSDVVTVSAETAAFKSAVSRVAVCASTEEARPVLTGVYLEISDELALTTADGFRLAHEVIPCTVNVVGDKPFTANVPATAIRNVHALFDEQVQFSLVRWGESLYIKFDNGRTILWAQCIQGGYPEYWRIVPNFKDEPEGFAVDSSTLLHLLRRAKVFANDVSTVKIVVSYAKKTASFYTNDENGYFSEVLPVAVNKPESASDFEFAVNIRFLTEMVASVSGELDFRTKESTSPAKMMCTGHTGWFGVLMPMHLMG